MEESPHLVRLSVIIPAYNEAYRLPESLRRLRAWLNGQSYSSEVLVIDDGSTDDTANVVHAAMTEWPSLSLHSMSHAGKGAAVRAGVRAARGDWVAFADADFSMPVYELERLRDVAEEVAGIAIASREATGAHRYGEPWYRHTMGRVFNRLVQILVLPGIQDTQCGFKCMPRGIALTLCAQQTIPGWGFDVELLVIARRHGFAVREVPIPWYYTANSRVRLGRDTINMLREVLTIRAKLRKGDYDPSGTSSDASDAALFEVRNSHAR